MADKTSLFSISCGTCAARLTVRSESAIGQVLACPRCGSMVMVEPPDDWVAPEADPLPPLPRRPRDLNDSQATHSTEFESLGPEIVSPRRNKEPAQRKPLAPPVQPSTSSPILPDGKWDSERAVERRKAMTWIAAIVGVCLIALAAIVWMIVSMTGGGESSQTAENSGTNQVSLDDAVAKSKADPDPTIDPAPEIETPLAQQATSTSDSARASDDSSNPDNNQTGPVETTNTPSVEPVPLDDPLVDSDPSEAVSPAGDAMTLDDSPLQKSFIEEVGPLQDLFTDPGIGVALNDFGESRQDSLIGQGNIFVPHPRPVTLDFEKQLNDTFPEVQVDQVPLVEFVRMLNLISGIPVQFDTHSVAYGHLRPLEKITYAGTDQSLINIINSALESQGLVAISDVKNSLVAIAFKDNDIFAERKLGLAPELAGDETHLGLLIELIKTTTGQDLWNTGGGQARIAISELEVTIESTGILYDEVQFLLSRLSAAARLNANPDDDAARENVRSYWKGSVAVFDTDCTVNEMQLKPANQILDQIARNEKLVAILDWRSLMAEGWNSDTQLPWPGHEATVEETLTDITSSMGLAWRMLGPAMVQITSHEQYRNGTRYEVYPCTLLLKKYSIEQVMRILQSQLYSDVQKTRSWTRVDYFPASNCIVARLPDPLLIRMETILDELARQ